VLEGRETEPFRDAAAVGPLGEVAGDEKPDATQTTTGNVLTAAQETQWDSGD